MDAWVGGSVLESVHYNPGECALPGSSHDQRFRELLESFNVVAFINFSTGTFHAELLFDRQGDLRGRHDNHALNSDESGEGNTSAVEAAPEEKPKIGHPCDPPEEQDDRCEGLTLTEQLVSGDTGGMRKEKSSVPSL